MTYTHLNILAEGKAEREFAKNVLTEHYFKTKNITVDSRCVATSRKSRGGLINYAKFKNDLLKWIKEEQQRQPYFSSMIDLYALPNDFPKFEESLKITDAYQRVVFLEKALFDDIAYPKFIPYIQLHEFEALLLANPANLLLEYPDKTKAVKQLQEIVKKHSNKPELVNTGKHTSPSKRIIQVIPEYESNKVSVGVTLAGIDDLVSPIEHCKHFREWLEGITQLIQQQTT
ncbi:MAG: DUF4276 family protein [Chitinophagales bacterium]|nr:DUF4276 family protein [Chitinophagales bacterium]